MQPVSRFNIKKIAAVAAVIFVALIVWSAFQKSHFDVAGTDPNLKDASIITPFIKVSFTKNISDKGLVVESSPKIVSSTSVTAKTLTIKLNTPLKPNTKYTITIVSVNSTGGQVITNKTLSFTPKDVPFDKLPKQQQDAIMNVQSQKLPVTTDPLLSVLPHNTLDYSIDPVFSEDANKNTILTLHIQLLLAPGVSGAEEANLTAQYKQEALDYISSQGRDPAAYTIEYEVVHQTLGGR